MLEQHLLFDVVFHWKGPSGAEGERMVRDQKMSSTTLEGGVSRISGCLNIYW